MSSAWAARASTYSEKVCLLDLPYTDNMLASRTVSALLCQERQYVARASTYTTHVRSGSASTFFEQGRLGEEKDDDLVLLVCFRPVEQSLGRKEGKGLLEF